MLRQLSEYFGQKTLIAATAVGLLIGFGTLFTSAFAHGDYSMPYTTYSWNDTHQAYLAQEARNDYIAYQTPRTGSHSNSGNSYTTSCPSTAYHQTTVSSSERYNNPHSYNYNNGNSSRSNTSQYSASRVLYNPDGTEVNSWDNSWNDTHQAYLAQEARNNSYNNSHTNYYPTNRSNYYSYYDNRMNNYNQHYPSVTYYDQNMDSNYPTSYQYDDGYDVTYANDTYY